MRDQFEAEVAQYIAQFYPASAESITASLLHMRDGDRYTSNSVTGRMMAIQANAAWWAWRQSRSEIVVELPECWPPSDLDYAVWREQENEGAAINADTAYEAESGYRQRCVAAIEAAGLQVKP